MHVLIDARMVTAKNYGIGRYVYNLIEKLIEIDKSNQYALIINDDYLLELTRNADNFALIKAKASWLSLAEQIEIPRIINNVKPDLYHAASWSVPFSQTCPVVATIYDLIHMIFPEHYSFVHRIYYNIFLPLVIKKVKRIITISESSRRDINKYFGYPMERIDIAFPAVAEQFTPIKDKQLISDFRSKRGLNKKIILYVGNRKKHKNIEGLVGAYALLSDEIRSQYEIVMPGDMDNELKEMADQLDIRQNIHCLTNVSDAELPLLYNSADIFVFPTLYEGFGMPPLEAMACGIPVITSNVASIPEVVGDAAIMVDPKNVKSLTDALIKLIENDKLRQEMKEKGLARARHFTWEDCAKRTLKTYMEAVK